MLAWPFAAALLLSAPHPSTERVPAPFVENDLADMSEDELVARVQERKNRVDREVFRELGSRRTQDSFDALVSCTKIVTSTWPLRYSYEAFSSFKGDASLTEQALELLEDEACGSEPKRSSAAAYALSLFGEAAAPGLRKVLKKSKDPRTRSTAMAPLLPEMAATGDKGEFKATCDNLVLTYRVHRHMGVEAFKAFAAAGGLGLFEKKLTDKKLSAELRGMMITALEETQDEAALELLAGGLKAKDPRVLYECMRALARRGATLHRDAAKRLTKSKDDAVRHEALVSVARLSTDDPKFIEATIKLAKDRDPIERGAAAISLGELRTTDALQALHELLEDKVYTVRVEALIGVSIARHARSVPPLISRLGECAGAEQDRVHRELRMLTGLDHGKSEQRWSQWWRAEGGAFTVPPLDEARVAEEQRDERRDANSTQSSFYGLNISSDRVCFVLDLSGSMNFKSKGGKTRLQILKTEMDRFLSAYPSGQLFNLVFFGNAAQRWRPELTMMNDKVREDARDHVRGLDAPGATAVYDGLLAAFEDPLVDTIYLLTDGGPSGGTIDDIDEIIMEVERWNSLRHVVIHTVAVGRESSLLEALSAGSNGDHVVVD